MKRNYHTQSHHDSMIIQLVQHLRAKGFSNIKADHIHGADRPEKILQPGAFFNGAGHVPDVTATDMFGQRHVFEVETSDSISTQHAASQIRTFATSGSLLSPVKCVVVVPSSSQHEARRVVAALRVKADVWTA